MAHSSEFDLDRFEHIPNEIIMEIFLILRNWRIGQTPPQTGSSWLTVTHVCRRWRNIAIGYPRLWSNPIMHKHSCFQLKTYLERSKAAPLTVDNSNHCRVLSKLETDGCRACGKVLAIALVHLPQVRVLNLRNILIEDIEAALDAPAPLLESLTLSFFGHDDDIPVILPERFLADAALSLREVSLEGCVFSPALQSRLFRGLTYLQISDHYHYPDHYALCAHYYPNVDELIEIFMACPDLKIVNLYSLMSFRRSTIAPIDTDDKQVTLPDFRSLAIHETDIKSANELFRRVNIPNFEEATIGVHYGNSSQIPAILSIFQNLCKNEPFDNVRVNFDGYHTLFDSLADGDEWRTMNLNLIHVDEEDNVEFSPDPFKVISVVTELLCNSIWAESTTLKISPDPNNFYSMLLWSSLFHAKSALSELILEFDVEVEDDGVLVDSMNDILLALWPDAEGNVPLSNLEVLTISFGDIHEVYDRLKLPALLQHRSHLGHSLSYLNFDKCNGREECEGWKDGMSQFVKEKIVLMQTRDEWDERTSKPECEET